MCFSDPQCILVIQCISYLYRCRLYSLVRCRNALRGQPPILDIVDVHTIAIA